MENPSLLIGLAGMAAAGVALACGAMLKAWAQWLELRRQALRLGATASPAFRSAAAELESLRERVRRLEAIASGVEA